MSFEWTPHRFSGGALALDIANSIVLRHDERRRADRFAVAEQFEAFAEAASRLCAERQKDLSFLPVLTDARDRLFRLREAVDLFYRQRAIGVEDALALANLLDVVADILRHQAALSNGVPLDLAAARSALALLSLDARSGPKICPNCGWLFIDRSKNKSRAWCDMAVCGNRAKARLHYKKKKMETVE